MNRARSKLTGAMSVATPGTFRHWLAEQLADSREAEYKLSIAAGQSKGTAYKVVMGKLRPTTAIIQSYASYLGASSHQTKGWLQALPKCLQEVKRRPCGSPPVGDTGYCPTHSQALRNARDHRAMMSGRANSIAKLQEVALNETKPSWSRWIASRALAKGMTLTDLGKEIGKVAGGSGGLSEYLWAVSPPRAPYLRMLDRLAGVLGPVPQTVMADVQAAHKDGDQRSYIAKRDKIRRWQQPKLLEAIEQMLPSQDSIEKHEPHVRASLTKRVRLVRQGVKALPWGNPVGIAGFELYMRASGIRLRDRLPDEYQPSGIRGRRGPSSLLLVQNTLRWLRSGHIVFLQCTFCLGIRYWTRAALERRKGDLGICRPCLAKFIKTPIGRRWLSELHKPEAQGAPAPAIPLPRKSGDRLESSELAERIEWLILFTLGLSYEQIADVFYDDDSGELLTGSRVRELIRATKPLLAKSEGVKISRFRAALDALEQLPVK